RIVVVLAGVAAPLLLVSCKGNSADQAKEEKKTPGKPDRAAAIQAARAKLSAEDLKLVQAQDICPISDERLGSMGTPVKVMVKEQAVFLCCESCRKKALAEADSTIETVTMLKEVQTSLAKLSPEERKLVEAQEFCAVMTDSRLGSMGA